MREAPEKARTLSRDISAIDENRMRKTQDVEDLGQSTFTVVFALVKYGSCSTRAVEARLSMGLLVLASDAVRSRRGKEAAATLLAPAVSTVLAADCPTEAVKHAREEQTCGGGPHEGKGLDAQVRGLAVAVEG